MSENIYSIIIGTGSYTPTRRIHNKNFLRNEFYDPDRKRLDMTNEEIIKKLEEITGIAERRYVTDDLVTSEIAFLAAKNALETGKIDKESLDYIIVSQNFGDVKADHKRSDFVPSLASTIKAFV